MYINLSLLPKVLYLKWAFPKWCNIKLEGKQTTCLWKFIYMYTYAYIYPYISWVFTSVINMLSCLLLNINLFIYLVPLFHCYVFCFYFLLYYINFKMYFFQVLCVIEWLQWNKYIYINVFRAEDSISIWLIILFVIPSMLNGLE
jgi:hypothetical protein